MKLNDLETDIVLALLRRKQASTTTLAHELFKPQNRDELKRVDQKIRFHAKKMWNDGLLLKNSTDYSVNKARVTLTEAKLTLDIGTEIPMGMMLIIIPSGEGDIWMRQILSTKTE